MAAVQDARKTSVEYARALAEAGFESFYLISLESAREVLTEARLQLIEAIGEGEPGSISELAETVDRDVAAVHRDLKRLARQGILELREGEGNRQRPVLLYDSIFIQPILA